LSFAIVGEVGLYS